VRRTYGTLIGEATAERVKMQLGCAYPQEDNGSMEVTGRNLAEGVPKMITITANEVLEALREPLAGIVTAIKLALEQTPPELGAAASGRARRAPARAGRASGRWPARWPRGARGRGRGRPAGAGARGGGGAGGGAPAAMRRVSQTPTHTSVTRTPIASADK